MKLILPKTFFDVEGLLEPLFFLAGPVKGGDNWQMKCCEKLKKKIKKFYAVIPCPSYAHPEHPFSMYKADGNDIHFDRQLPWERHYLGHAATRARKGCLIFWLPKESTENPRPDGYYGRDTMGELGEWRGRLMAHPIQRVVIGGQKEFPGFDIICRNFKHALGEHFMIHQTLEATVEAAIKKAYEC